MNITRDQSEITRVADEGSAVVAGSIRAVSFSRSGGCVSSGTAIITFAIETRKLEI